jgi:hypothetical protein
MSDQYAMSEALRPDAELLIRDLLTPRERTRCEIKQTEKDAEQSDRIYHLDFQLYAPNDADTYHKLNILTIGGQVFRPQRTFTGDWKRASWNNWHEDGYDTVTWSPSLETGGECDLVVWCYPNKEDTQIEGWVIAAWKGYLREAIYDQRLAQMKRFGVDVRGQWARGPVRRNYGGGDIRNEFRYMHFKDLLDPGKPFLQHIIGYGLEPFAPPIGCALQSGTPKRMEPRTTYIG